MRTYRLPKPGSLDDITPGTEDVPTPGPTQLLVKTHAAAINRRDLLITTGRYPMPARPGVIPLTEDDLTGSLATIRREFVGNRVELEALCQAVAAHRIRPVVDRVFGLDDAAAAYRSYRDEGSFGKIVIESMSQPPEPSRLG